MENTDPGEEPS